MTDTQPPTPDLDDIQARNEQVTTARQIVLGEVLGHARTDVPALLAYARHLEARAAELEQQLAAATTQVPQHLRLAIAEDLMELHNDPATPEKYRAGLRYASRRIPHAQDGGY